MQELQDLTNVTAEKLDSMSIDAVVNGSRIQFDPKTYEVQDGVMFFRKPLKTEPHILNFSTLDRISITKSIGTGKIYVFAVSAEEKYNENLIEFAKKNNRKGKKYKFFISRRSEEVNAID